MTHAEARRRNRRRYATGRRRYARVCQGDHQGQPEEGRTQGQNGREDRPGQPEGNRLEADQARRQAPEAGSPGRIEEGRCDRVAPA